MKLEIISLPAKPRKLAQVGDVITFTNRHICCTIKVIIVHAGINEYRVLNLDNFKIGNVVKSTPDELMWYYSNKKDFKHYHKDSWQTKLVLEELK